VIICLCGPAKFTEEYKAALIRLAMAGHTVIGTPDLSGVLDPRSAVAMDAVRAAHLRLIDLADSLYIINVGGYVGSDTRQEITYARMHRKTITYLEPSHG
jgi:hypothetical protein